MQAVHRSFFSSIHTAVEKALSEQCTFVDIKNKKKVDSLVEELGDKLTKTQKRVIKSLSPKKPSFNDYLDAALKKNGTIPEHRKTAWRKYFNCLSVVRNKVSHSDCALNHNERELLMQNGFSPLVNGTELQINSRFYSQVCNHVIQFFQELGYTLR